MAARRARIKGIANIPVRRKNDTVNSDTVSVQPETVSQENSSLLSKTSNEEIFKTSDTVSDIVGKSVSPLILSSGILEKINKTDITNDTQKCDKNISLPLGVTKLTSNEIGEIPQEIILPPACTVDISNNNNKTQDNNLLDNLNMCKEKTGRIINERNLDNVSSDIEVKSLQTKENSASSQSTNTENKFTRRWISKPTIKIPAVTRKQKPEILKFATPVGKQVVPENVLSPTETEKVQDQLENITKSVAENNASFDDEVSDIFKIQSDCKSVTNSGSSLTCPLSPNKTINRARIRPIPRLIRRNSMQGSASESEDDGRKSHTRIRNDSICSSVSVPTETRDENIVVPKEKQYKTFLRKKIRGSEQSRKMSEARREFNLKFGTAVPDRKKLTMIDLIFYNPVTNPMPERSMKEKIQENEEKVEEITNEIDIEEKEDNPDDPDDEPGSDEENIPVPQVKVGPNGEIILDEQSLVIEQTGTKKAREQIANSEIVIDDLDTGYGIYKRPKRSKDWSTTETLRFYRTLNTVGTDFSLMLSLFPGRTRRELKLKFKKEERINRTLIDKALMNPLDFNLSELEQQLREEELLKKSRKEIASKVQKTKQAEKTKSKGKRKTSFLSRQLDEEVETTKTVTIVRKITKEKRACSVLESGINSILESDSEDELTEEPAEKNIKLNDDVPSMRPTRTCRLQKQNDYKKMLGSSDEDENDLENEMQISETHQENEKEILNNELKVTENESATNVVLPEDGNDISMISQSLPSVEPGSLMILSSMVNGQQVFKVFMVTPGRDNVPINLSQDVVQSLASSLGSAQQVTLDLPVINNESVSSA